MEDYVEMNMAFEEQWLNKIMYLEDLFLTDSVKYLRFYQSHFSILQCMDPYTVSDTVIISSFSSGEGWE